MTSVPSPAETDHESISNRDVSNPSSDA
jgi:hypothetical protein